MTPPAAPAFYALMAGAHRRITAARLRELRSQSKLMLAVLAAFVFGYLVIGYFLFFKGLDFISDVAVIGTLLSRRILYLIFAFFFFMLMFSNVIIGYSAMYKSRETEWLLSLPVPGPKIYRWKLMEAAIVASWALLFLCAPLMAAYGRVFNAPPVFYLQAAAAFIPFVLMPAAGGAWVVLAIARFLSPRVFKVLLLAGGAGAVVWLLSAMRPTSDLEAASPQEIVSFNILLQHTEISLHPALPSAWMGRALLGWLDGYPGEAWFFFLLMASNAAFALMLCLDGAARFFRNSWLRAEDSRTGESEGRRVKRAVEARRRGFFETLLQRMPGLGRPAAALMLKDTRLFWRDPVQWSQFAIFFGLLAIYVVNLRNVSADLSSPFWAVAIGYLNLGASALTLSTLTTRFVYPQFSLEGKRLWILGMAPLGIQRVLWLKFLQSTAASTAITLCLTVGSCLMLNLPSERIAVFSAAIVCMSASLNALAVGLGTLFPNLQEDNPSKIVSGFGGTLCLVLSFVYILCTMLLLVLPAAVDGAEAVLLGTANPLWSVFSIASASALSAVTTIIPMALALQRVKSMEI